MNRPQSKRLLGSFLLAFLLTPIGLAFAIASIHGPEAYRLIAAVFIPVYILAGFVTERLNRWQYLPGSLVWPLLAVTQWIYAYMLVALFSRLRKKRPGDQTG